MSKGKKYGGQKFFPVKTEEDVKADVALAEVYDPKPSTSNPHPKPTVDLTTYFALRSINGHAHKAAMLAFTKVRRASVESWDDIFKTF